MSIGLSEMSIEVTSLGFTRVPKPSACLEAFEGLNGTYVQGQFEDVDIILL